MACFTVPAAEAVITTMIKRSADKNAKGKEVKNPFVKKLGILNNMLWGGSALLAFEHVWHGEVTPWFPFLTAALNAEDRAQMLKEMATSGVGMALLVTAVWAVIVAVSSAAEARAVKENEGGTE